MEYPTQKYDRLLGLPGFSDVLLNNHFALYQGYVVNTNTLQKELQTLREVGKIGTPEFSELRRRFGWEWNGMRLHEMYFENLSKTPSSLSEKSSLTKSFLGSFGSLENWERDFRAIGAMRGIGWALLVLDEKTQTLFNTWIGEHDLGHLAGAKPILVMDVFEHAYVLDYGIKRADYIQAFMQAVDWSVAEQRFLA